MADAYDMIQEISPSELKSGNMAVALGASTKGGDYERAVKFARSHQPGSKYYRDGITVTEPPIKVQAEDYVYPAGSKHAGQPISATNMRDAIAQNDIEEFKYHLPKMIRKNKSDNDIQNLLNDLAGRGSYEKHDVPNHDEDTAATPPLNPAALYKIAEGVDLYHLIEKVVEGDIDIEKALEELSSMAGGNVEIGVGAGKRDKKKKNPTIFREDEEEQTAVDTVINPILQSFEELEAERAHAKEAIVNYLKDNGPTLETDMRWSLMNDGHSRDDLITGVRELDAQETNRIGRYYKWGEIKSWMLYLIPEHQHLVPGADRQATMFEQTEAEDISKEQLSTLKMQIIYYLLAHGPKPANDVVLHLRLSAHHSLFSLEELHKAASWAFSELKREGKITWREENNEEVWFLIPQHALFLANTQEPLLHQEDRGVRGEPGSNYPSTRDADDRTNEEDPETGKTGNVGPKYKIAREHSEVEEVVNYLLDVGVYTG